MTNEQPIDFQWDAEIAVAVLDALQLAPSRAFSPVQAEAVTLAKSDLAYRLARHRSGLPTGPVLVRDDPAGSRVSRWGAGDAGRARSVASPSPSLGRIVRDGIALTGGEGA